MTYSIANISLIKIKDARSGATFFGPNQAWFSNPWHRMSGCGPTSAATLTAYLAHTRSSYGSLYNPSDLSKQSFIKHMNALFKYVTPGMMGVNHINKLRDGVLDFAKSRDVQLTPHTYALEDNDLHMRDLDAFKSFVQGAMEADCPLAFLSLNSGAELTLQKWHWITITSVDIRDHQIIATASDEGRTRVFDLQLWFTTTKMHGGLVYFT